MPPLRPLGLALGAGGLAGAVHVGVLQGLKALSLEPDRLAGTSAGAVVAALYASGRDPDELAALACRLPPSALLDLSVRPGHLLRLAWKLAADRWRLPVPRPLPPPGLYCGDRLERWLYQQTGGRRLAGLVRPAAFVALDLWSGAPVFFLPPRYQEAFRVRFPRALLRTSEHVARAARASAAIPILFRPVVEKEALLVDGGLTDPVPARLLPALGARAAIAVNLSAASPAPFADNLLEVAGRSLELLEANLAAGRLEGAHALILQVRTPSLPLDAWEAVPELIRIGREAVEAAAPWLREQLSTP